MEAGRPAQKCDFSAVSVTDSEAAAPLGCRVALYDHGGWFGEPENQAAVIGRRAEDGAGRVRSPRQMAYCSHFRRREPVSDSPITV